MTIILNRDQERAIQEAIQAGLIRSVDEFIGTAIKALPRSLGETTSRGEAVRRTQEFGDEYRLSLGEPVTRKLWYGGAWPARGRSHDHR